MNTIISARDVSKTINKLHDQKKKIVVVGGCFDILHIGHIYFLQRAKSLGDLVIVLLEDDKTIMGSKGVSRPIYIQKDRAKVLSELRSVDIVLLLGKMENDTSYDTLVKKIKPAIIAATFGDPYLHHKIRQAKLTGAQVIQIKKIKDSSTSNIATLLAKKNTL